MLVFVSMYCSIGSYVHSHHACLNVTHNCDVDITNLTIYDERVTDYSMAGVLEVDGYKHMERPRNNVYNDNGCDNENIDDGYGVTGPEK